MQTPPKIPASSRTPRAMFWLALLAIVGIAAALLLPPLTSSRPPAPQPELVTRAEADHALHMAAQMGHPFATQMLALLLDRGGIVKRDPVAARYWAERAVPNPASGVRKGDLVALLGRLLATSDRPEERARGLELLERTSKAGVFGAKRQLAKAIRRDDPV